MFGKGRGQGKGKSQKKGWKTTEISKRGGRGDEMKWGRAKGGGRQTKVEEGRGAPQRTTAMEDEDCTGGSSLSSLLGMRVGEAGGREIPKEAV